MNDPCAKSHAEWGLPEFRDRFPGLRLTHLSDCGLQFEGELAFRAQKNGSPEIKDTYEIRSIVSGSFPRKEPEVFETGGRIPSDYHKMMDGSLCLGSPIRVNKTLAENPTLVGFVENLVIPYLYNRSCLEQFDTLPVGELAHNGPGLLADYEEMFRIDGVDACIGILEALSTKKRIANKRPCPCGSRLRLGRCHNTVVNPLRRLGSRSYYAGQQAMFQKQFPN